jgi:hypothetical protein
VVVWSYVPSRPLRRLVLTMCSTDASSLSPFRIITGVGKHSTNQNPVLMPAVIKLLDREGWIWKWDGFSRGGAGGGHGAVIITGLR